MTRPILCWVGGKTRLKKQIIKRIPKHNTYIEPFVGGGSVFFGKPPSEHEVINDKKTNLIKFYKQFKNTKTLKCNHNVSKKGFETAKKKVESGKGSVCDFLLVNKTSHACAGEKYVDYNKTKYPKMPQKAMKNIEKDFPKLKNRLKNTKIENKDYREIIRKYNGKNNFFYIDPPYPDTACPESYTCEGITSKDVLNSVKRIKGKFLLSYKDTPEIRHAFKKEGFKVEKVKTSYTLQKGRDGKEKKTGELLISNY